MIADSWLGTYRHGIDEEDGIYIVELSRADDQTIRFVYSYKCDTNHGFTHEGERGFVVSASETEIVVEIVSGSSSSWEDLFKEHLTSKVTEPVRETVKVVRIENGRPVLQYGRGEPELVFVSDDD